MPIFHRLADGVWIASILEMSRRSRRRKNAGGVGWLGKAALGAVLVCLLGAGVIYMQWCGAIFTVMGSARCFRKR